MAGTLTFPIPLSHIQGRYLLFDITAIAYLREHHQICGVFIGTLPQNPSQNVFMGLPMEIMPEEAQVLIDEAVCYILDDPRAHDVALAQAKVSRQRQSKYVKEHEGRAAEIAEEKAREKEFEKRKALRKVKARQGRDVESMGSSIETVVAAVASTSTEDNHSKQQKAESAPTTDEDPDPDSLFDTLSNHTENNSTSNQTHTDTNTNTLTITPATSTTLLPELTTKPPRRIPNLSRPSYTLYKHLNSLSYFQTPGLRFGCQFCVYPGDPLRFHSHFLAVGYDWDEEIDLMDVVGGGRLGTGVKKGWLVGGRETGRGVTGEEGRVRTWSVEWAGM